MDLKHQEHFTFYLTNIVKTSVADKQRLKWVLKNDEKIVLCTVMVIVIILSAFIVANAWTIRYFTNKQVNSSYYTHLACSIKSTKGQYGTLSVTDVIGDSHAMFRAATNSFCPML